MIEAGEVRLTRGLLGIGPTLTLACGDLQDVATKIVMQTGGSSGIPYYGLTLVDAYGETFEAARYIKDKREAVWLAAEMKRLIAAGR